MNHNMKMCRFLPKFGLALAVALAAVAPPLMANTTEADVRNELLSEGLFSARIDVEGVDPFLVSFSKIEDLQDVITEEQLQHLEQIGGAYTTNSHVAINLNMRGLDFAVTYEGTDLKVVSEAIALDRTFTGATRDQSEAAFREYFESNSNNILTQVLQYWVANSSTDPVAGNPNALINRMNSKDFGTTLAAPMLLGTQTVVSPFGASASLGRYSTQDNYDVNVFSVPLEYTHQFEEDPRRQINLSLPLTYFSVDGSNSYDASFGISYRHPMSDDWSLSPGVRVGALGSVDLGAAAVVYSASLKSEYIIYHNDLNIRIGNLIGGYSTMDLKANEKSFNYDITNQITKNGVSFEGSSDTKIFGKPSSWEAAVAHTYVWGSDVFIDNYVDLIFTFGTRYSDSGDSWDALRFGVSATFGSNDYKGFGLNFGYTF